MNDVLNIAKNCANLNIHATHFCITFLCFFDVNLMEWNSIREKGKERKREMERWQVGEGDYKSQFSIFFSHSHISCIFSPPLYVTYQHDPHKKIIFVQICYSFIDSFYGAILSCMYLLKKIVSFLLTFFWLNKIFMSCYFELRTLGMGSMRCKKKFSKKLNHVQITISAIFIGFEPLECCKFINNTFFNFLLGLAKLSLYLLPFSITWDSNLPSFFPSFLSFWPLLNSCTSIKSFNLKFIHHTEQESQFLAKIL